jgi:hypothetical protein
LQKKKQTEGKGKDNEAEKSHNGKFGKPGMNLKGIILGKQIIKFVY